jgi:hypothetical protein
MFPYYLLIIFPFYLATVEYILQSNRGDVFSKKNSINKSIILFFSIWFVMLAFRHINCGIDLRVYESHFYNISKLDFFNALTYSSLEQFYYAFNYFVAQVYPDFRLFLIVTAALCAGIPGWFYYKESKFAPLTILLFVTNACFVMFYSGLRQSLAMLFAIPAYYMTKQKRLVPFILIVVLAKFFHNSAIYMLLLYPVFHTQLRSKHFFLIMLLITFFFIFKAQIFTAVLPFFNEKYSGAAIIETNGYTMWIMFILFLVYSFWVLDDSKMNADCLGLRNIIVIMTLIQGFAAINPIAMRMNYYFILLFPIIIPKLMEHPKEGAENIVRISRWIMVVFFMFYFFFSIHSGRNGLGAFPYVAFWE